MVHHDFSFSPIIQIRTYSYYNIGDMDSSLDSVNVLNEC